MFIKFCHENNWQDLLCRRCFSTTCISLIKGYRKCSTFSVLTSACSSSTVRGDEVGENPPNLSLLPFMMMATKSDTFDDRKSVTDTPPTYDEIALSASLLDSVHSIGRWQPSLFSFLWKKQRRTIVLSCIRDIVSAPNLTPFSIKKIANACAAALPPAQFAHLLQKPDIEHHTAMYWSIVNHEREAFFALATFIPQFTPVCSSDLRLACIATNNHELFTQLDLGYVHGEWAHWYPTRLRR